MFLNRILTLIFCWVPTFSAFAGDPPGMCKSNLGRSLRFGFNKNSESKSRPLLLGAGVVAGGLGVFYTVKWLSFPSLPASQNWTADEAGNQIPKITEKPLLTLAPGLFSIEYLVHNGIESWGTVKISKSEISGHLKMKFFDTQQNLLFFGNLEDGPRRGERVLSVFAKDGKFLGSAHQSLNEKNEWGSWELGASLDRDISLNSLGPPRVKDPRVLILVDSLQAFLDRSQVNEFWTVLPR